MSTAPEELVAEGRFVHEGLFYRGAEEYLSGLVPFVRAGLAEGEPVLVAVPGPNLDLIRTALGPTADRVRFRDMTVAGRNPGRIIPAVLLAFVADHPGRRVRIIGEPIWPGRTDAEYPACVQHEALINLALAGRPATVLCPYDAAGLAPPVLADAEGTHPVLVSGRHRRPCAGYVEPGRMVAAFNRPLPDPPGPADVLVFDVHAIPAVRERIAGHAIRAGLSSDRTLELQLAVHEAAVNTVQHTGGPGTLRVWPESGGLVCEIRDSGHIADPLAGRVPPAPDQSRGRGLLLINSLCDLVQVHTEPAGTAIRLHMRQVAPRQPKRPAGTR